MDLTDGRPVSATIAPFLALALVLGWAGVVLASGSTSARSDLLARATSWGAAATRGDLRATASFVDPAGRGGLEDAVGRLHDLVGALRRREMRVRRVRVDGDRGSTIVWVAADGLRGYGRYVEYRLDWVRRPDGLWYLSL
jgi:hypothetical protein